MELKITKKVIKLPDLKVPKGYRIIKLWELAKLANESNKKIIKLLAGSYVWVRFRGELIQIGDSGDGILFKVYGNYNYDTDEHYSAFGVFIKNNEISKIKKTNMIKNKIKMGISKKDIYYGDFKIPEGYRNIKLSELIKLSEEGHKRKIINILKRYGIWADYKGDLVRVYGSHCDFFVDGDNLHNLCGEITAFGLFVKLKEGEI